MGFLDKIEDEYVIADKSDVANQRVKRSQKKRRLARKPPKPEKPSVSDLKKETKKVISLDDPIDEEPIETRKTISLDEDEFDALDANDIEALMDKYLTPAKPKRTAPATKAKPTSLEEEPIETKKEISLDEDEEPIEPKFQMSLDDKIDIALNDLQDHIDNLQESCDSVARDRDELDAKELAVEIREFKQARRKLSFKLDKIQGKKGVSEEQKRRIGKLWKYLSSIDDQLIKLAKPGAEKDIEKTDPGHKYQFASKDTGVVEEATLTDLKEKLKTGELSGEDSLLTQGNPDAEGNVPMEWKPIKDTFLSEQLQTGPATPAEDEEDIDPDSDELDDLREGDLKNKRNALKLMKDPHLLVLNPMVKPAEFKTALENASIQGVLSQSILFKEADSEPIHGTLVYFVRGALAPKLSNEISLTGAHFSLTPFANTLFRKVSPFDTLTLDKDVGQLNAGMLRRELNAEWHKYRKEEATGLEIPAFQMRNFNSINYARFLSLKQRSVEMYHGDTPTGAGSPDLIYFLASEAEANACRKVLVNLKLPVQFYNGLYVTPDIDTEFKSIAPKSFKPSNAVILKGKSPFKPNAVVDKGEKGDEEITQLDMLHAFAEEILQNKLKVPGGFVKQRHVIGTHVVHFNADMTLCIVWGSPSYHATVTQDEILEMLPFVEKALTKYM